MDFPSYVPNAVRELVTRMLDGDGGRDFGWRSGLRSAECELRNLESQQQGARDNPDALDGLRVKYAAGLAQRDAIGEDIGTLERLVLRPEMQDAYARLVGKLGTDAELKAFIRAAWGAHMNYNTFRDQLNEAAEIARKVAEVAGTLHDLLRRAEGVGPYLPTEFFGIRSLLRNTDHDPGDHSHHLWQEMRHVVLGDRPDPVPQDATAVPILPQRIELVPPQHDTPLEPEEQARSVLTYAWGTAPHVCHFVAAMQRAARDCIPIETEAIGAAVSSRKRNPKTEYLRGFAWLLRNNCRVALTAEIMNAMAVTATVVLNDARTAVTYDDVRKAVASIVV